MRIKTLSYIDKTTGWELKPVSFNQLTLLVGASGVGKTRILRSILTLQRIAEGKSFSGVKWHIEFISANGTQYTWEGEFEINNSAAYNVSFEYDAEIKEIPIIYERVYMGNELIIERDVDGIIFNRVKTVKLSGDRSVFYLLREEEQIKEAAIEFDKIKSYTTERDTFVNYFPNYLHLDERINKYNEIEEVRNLPVSLAEKLYFAYKRQKQVFDRIESNFIDIFHHVEEVKIEPTLIGSPISASGSLFIQIQIKERGADRWIPESEISSGMLKTLVYIAQLQLCADSSLILIDEFENSLGINCIDELTSSILSSERGLQFIITSHHPYIINNINHTNWKIVTRKGSAVTARDAAEFHFDKSKHKAFTQLINLDLYSEGVES